MIKFQRINNIVKFKHMKTTIMKRLVFNYLAIAFLALTSCDDEGKTFTVTFNSNDGSVVETKIVKDGDRVAEPDAPTREGYSFGGWYTGNNSFNNRWNFTSNTVTANIILFAKWIENVVNFTVTFNSDEGSAVTDQTIAQGALAVKPAAPTRAGFVFGGWYKEATLINEWNFSTDVVNGDVTLFAKWIALLTVTFDSKGGSDVPMQIVEQGGKATKPGNPSRDNHNFAGWATADNEASPLWNFETIVEASMTLYARWNFVENSVAAEEGKKAAIETCKCFDYLADFKDIQIDGSNLIDFLVAYIKFDVCTDEVEEKYKHWEGNRAFEDAFMKELENCEAAEGFIFEDDD